MIILQILFVMILLLGIMGCGDSSQKETPAVRPRATLSPNWLRCEYSENPIGIATLKPRLSWIVEPAGKKKRALLQTAYQIIVASDRDGIDANKCDLWDSGRIESDRTVNIPYEGRPLNSSWKCYWKVRVWDNESVPSEWSEAAIFETGLLNESDWSAKWIEPGAAEKSKAVEKNKPRRSQLFRKEFTLPTAPAYARLYVTGLGLYEPVINGKSISEDIFTPGFTLYPKRVQYQTYKVTWFLNEGKNAIGAILGNGWWSSGLGMKGGDACFSKQGEDIRLLLQLDVECVDGTRHRFATGPDWKSHPSPILEDTLYHGEHYDARLEQPGWDSPGFDDSLWEAVKPVVKPIDNLFPQKVPPIRNTGLLNPIKISKLKDGVYIFDFNQNHSGRCMLRVRASAGTKITIRHAETLNPDGSLYTENYRAAKATDTYICKGEGVEEWSPRFTYRGFRYAEVTGLPEGYEPKESTLMSQAIHNDVFFTGRFNCSNNLLNRIWRNVLWGQRSNLHSVPTDCPQRDERLGWMGDAQVFAPTSCWNMDMALFYTKWMRDIVDSQHQDGAVTDVSPVIVVTKPAAPGWGDAVVIIPWTVYLFYGDTRILSENYDAMKRFVEYMRYKSIDDLYETKGYGDWVAVEKVPSEPIGSAYYFYSTKLLSRIAGILDKKEDEAKYSELACRIATAFHKRHFNIEKGHYGSGAQTENLMPLAFGITPEELRYDLAEKIVDDVIKRDYHLSTGFLGTNLLLPILTEYGNHTAACKVALGTTYPSLGYMLEKGATTIWERWNSDVAAPDMNSRNHFAFGCMASWYYESLAGIRIDQQAPGFKHFIVRPMPAEGVQSAEMNYLSVHGLIDNEWRIEDQTVYLKITAPANTTATVYIPCEDASAIMENGEKANDAEGVTFVKTEKGSSIFMIGSGAYSFQAPYTGYN